MLLEDGQRQLVVVYGQVGLVLYVVEVAQAAIDDGACIVDVHLSVALHRGHRVDDGQRLPIQFSGLVVLLAPIVHLCEMAQHILPHIQSVQLVAQGQCLAPIVAGPVRVVVQIAAHQLVVSPEQLFALGRTLALQRRFKRVYAGIAVVVVSVGHKADHQAQCQVQVFHIVCKDTIFFP